MLKKTWNEILFFRASVDPKDGWMELNETRVAARLGSCGDGPAFHINPLPPKDAICFSTHYWTPSIIISDALWAINVYKYA